MKKFWVIWTYVGNYSDLMEIDAKDAEEAASRVSAFFSADFQKRGNVYVFDQKPAFLKLRKE